MSEKAKSHVNHSKLAFSERVGDATVNVYTGKALFERRDLTTGANSYGVGVSHVFDSEADRNTDTCVGNGWKLNIQQHLIRTEEMDDAGEFLYRYFDAYGHAYDFEKYAAVPAAAYFDRTGSGMTLHITSTEIYIEDPQGNKKYFDSASGAGKLIKTVSGINSAITQKIEYDAGGRPSSVYDDRIPDRKIEFWYLGGRLSQMTLTGNSVFQSVEYGYDATGNLTSVKQYANGVLRYTAVYRYENGLLTYAVDVTDNSTIKIAYDDVDRVKSVSTGLMKTEFVYSAPRFALFPSDSLFGGTGKYCGQREREFLGYKVGGDEGDFDPSHESSLRFRERFTVVKNAKGVKHIYFFNKKGFTSSVFEYAGEGEYKTLFRQTGFAVLPSSAGESVNGSSAKKCTESLTVSADDSMIGDYTRHLASGHAEARDCVISCWLKLTNTDGLSSAFAAVTARHNEDTVSNITGTPGGIPIVTSRTVDKCGKATVDVTAIDAWQYVAVPVEILQYSFSGHASMTTCRLQSLTLTVPGAEFEIADMRMTPGAVPVFKLSKGSPKAPSATISLAQAERIQYTVSGNTVSRTINGDFFMTENDIAQTCLEKYRANGSSFALICNAGTKRIGGVSYVALCASTEEYEIRVENVGGTSYCCCHYLTVSSGGGRAARNFIGFTKYRGMTCTVEETCVYESADSAEPKSASSVVTDKYQRTLKETSAYGVIKETYYDAYGNVTKTVVGGAGTDETIEETYSYDENKETLTGVADNVSGGAVHTAPETDPVKRLLVGCRQNAAGDLAANEREYRYNAFGDELREAELKANGVTCGKNTLRFDDDGRLASVSNSVETEYNIKYDRFGNATEFRLGNRLLLAKRYDYNNNTVTAEYRHSSGEKDSVGTSYDAYGRVTGLLNNGERTLSLIYEDADKNFRESPSCANIREMNDRITGKTYCYNYDPMSGRPTGYTVRDTRNGNERTLKVACIGDGKTNYEFWDWALSYENEIVYDEKCLLAPRVTKVTDNSVYGASWSFEYDGLGRYVKRTGEGPELNITYKTGTALRESLAYKNVITVGQKYDARGNIVKVTETRNGTTAGTVYTYDAVNHLRKEINDVYGTLEYTYDDEGNIATVIRNGVTETRRYEQGRLMEVDDGSGNIERYIYDDYGNPTHYKSETINMRWECGTLLKEYGDITYTYDAQGKLHTRECNGRISEQYYDGDKLIAMEVGDKQLRFFYDLDGVAGFKVGTTAKYTYVKDGRGNVLALCQGERIVGRYLYDAWGKCTVVDANGNAVTAWDNPALLNPIRWKSRYYDNESGLYNIEGRWYDPERGRYISPASPETLLQNAAVVYALNLYALTTTNPLALLLACGSIYPSLDFYNDGEYKTWWEKWGQTVLLGIGIVATILACIFSGPCGGAATAASIGSTLATLVIETVISTAIGLAIGGITTGVQSAVAGSGFWQGFAEYVQGNFVEILVTSLALSAVSVAAANMIGHFLCFKAGTQIETETGAKAIEAIEVGDKVLAYDEVTGEQSYKEVVRLFRNTTLEWCNIDIQVDGETERITSTPGHKYYLPENVINRETGENPEQASYKGLSAKWVSASSLQKGDKVLLSDGRYGTIEVTRIEQLTKVETTYNFEVADYHTYYVGENKVCVHNAGCGMQNKVIFNEDIGKYKNVRMDLEMGGSGKVNLHMHAIGDKFIYNGTTYMNSAGVSIPNVIGNSKIVTDGFMKAIKFSKKVGWPFP